MCACQPSTPQYNEEIIDELLCALPLPSPDLLLKLIIKYLYFILEEYKNSFNRKVYIITSYIILHIKLDESQ